MKISFTPVEFKDVKYSIIKYLKTLPQYAGIDFPENGTLTKLVDILAYVTTYNNYYSAVSVNESFLPYAQIPKNVYALARQLGYRPSRKKSAEVKVSLRISSEFISRYLPDTTKNFYMSMGDQFTSNTGKSFTLMEMVLFKYDSITGKYLTYKDGNLDSDTNPNYFTLKQGSFSSNSYMGTNAERQRVPLGSNIENNEDSIIVTNISSLVSNDERRWNTINSLVDSDFFSIGSDSFVQEASNLRMFLLEEDENGTTLQFGDGYLGKIPTTTDAFTIQTFKTDGVGGNNATTFTYNGSMTFIAASGAITTLPKAQLSIALDRANYPSGSTGGQSAESLYSIRNIAPVSFSGSGRLCNETDFDVWLDKQKFVPLKTVKTIRGEDYVPKQFGSVVINCIKDFDTYKLPQILLLNSTEQDTLTAEIRKRNISGIEPVFVNPGFLKIDVTGDVFFNRTLYDKNTVIARTENVINLFFMQIAGFNTYFKYSNLVQQIDNLPEVDHSQINVDFSYLRRTTYEELETPIQIYLTDDMVAESVENSDKNLTETNVLLCYLKWNGNFFNVQITSGTVSCYFEYAIHDEVDADDTTIGHIYVTERFNYLQKLATEDVIDTTTKKYIGRIDYTTGQIDVDLSTMKYMSENNINTTNFMDPAGLPAVSPWSGVVPARWAAIKAIVSSIASSHPILSFSDLFIDLNTDNGYSPSSPYTYITPSLGMYFDFAFAFQSATNDYKGSGNVIPVRHSIGEFESSITYTGE